MRTAAVMARMVSMNGTKNEYTIVSAESVQRGEDRIWLTGSDQPFLIMDRLVAGSARLHGDPRPDEEHAHAIVYRPTKVGTPTNEHTPEATRGEVAWQEMVWRQAFNATLPTAAAYVGSVDEGVAHAQAVADAALEAWKKRWQR